MSVFETDDFLIKAIGRLDQNIEKVKCSHFSRVEKEEMINTYRKQRMKYQHKRTSFL